MRPVRRTFIDWSALDAPRPADESVVWLVRKTVVHSQPTPPREPRNVSDPVARQAREPNRVPGPARIAA